MRIGVKFMSVNLATIGFLWLKGWVKWTKMCKKALDCFKFLLYMPLWHHNFYNSLIATLKNIENTVLLLFFCDAIYGWAKKVICYGLLSCSVCLHPPQGGKYVISLLLINDMTPTSWWWAILQRRGVIHK